MPNEAYVVRVSPAPASLDVFAAVADSHRREILDLLLPGEQAVGEIVGRLSMPQPLVSKRLRVLSEAGLVTCRADGRRRYYRLAPEHLQPVHDWLTKYERVMNERMDRIDDYLQQLQRQGEGHDT